MVVFRDSGRQSGEIARLRQRDQMADAAVAHLSDLEARRLGTELISYARAYPDLDANVAFQMASNGIPAHSRLVADVAAESSELRAERSGPRGGRSFARQGEARRYGVAEFTDDGVFKGYSRFSEDENIQLVATIAQADPDTRADVYRSIRAGEFDPSRVVESISTANRPHRSLLNLFPKEDSETRVDQAHLRDKVYALAPTAAEALAARYRDGEFDNLGHLVVDGLNPALADQYGDDWRTAAFQISAEDQMVQEQINNALVEAELARVDGEGGGSWVGSLTRPLVAVFTAGGQFATNRFRQATGDLVEGIQGLLLGRRFRAVLVAGLCSSLGWLLARFRCLRRGRTLFVRRLALRRWVLMLRLWGCRGCCC